MKRLPPLASLQAFDAAARHENFSKAAEELCITHGAVSRQIKNLEVSVGKSLFERHGPNIFLTSDGKMLRDQLTQPLMALHDVLFSSSTPAKKTFTIHTLPSIYSAWLQPKLAELNDLLNNVQLQFVTSHDIYSPPPNEFCVAIRYGKFKHDGLFTHKIIGEKNIFVATKKWLKTYGENPEYWPQDATLIHSGQAWPKRIIHSKTQKNHTLPIPTGIIFNDAHLQIQAAIEGHGIAWTRYEMVKPYLKKGVLKEVQNFEGQTDSAYWLACRQEYSTNKDVINLLHWLGDKI